MSHPNPPDTDAAWMRQCLELGRQAYLAGNPPVGAVLVRHGKLIGAGQEAGKTKNDITCHAEIEAIRDARQRGHTELLAGATLYTTHEPCIMCSYAIRHHRIARVVMGLTVAEVGGYSSPFPVLTTPTVARWGPPPEVVAGVLWQECKKLGAGG